MNDEYSRMKAAQKRFYEGLWNDLSITKDYFRKHYRYAGGNYPTPRKYFMTLFHEPPSIEYDKDGSLHLDKCYCEHDIVEQCFVYHKEGYDYNKANGLPLLTDYQGLPMIIVMGNLCIKRECEHSGKSCEKCGAKHMNRTDNLCNECRKKAKEAAKPKLCGRCKKEMYKVLTDGSPNNYKNCYHCNQFYKKLMWSQRDPMNLSGLNPFGTSLSNI